MASIIFGILFAVTAAASVVRGGVNAAQQQQKVCAEVQKTNAEIATYSQRSAVALACLDNLDHTIVQALNAQQIALATASAKLLTAQNDFKTQYVIMEVVVVVVIMTVAGLLLAKRLRIL